MGTAQAEHGGAGGSRTQGSFQHSKGEKAGKELRCHRGPHQDTLLQLGTKLRDTLKLTVNLVMLFNCQDLFLLLVRPFGPS